MQQQDRCARAPPAIEAPHLQQLPSVGCKHRLITGGIGGCLPIPCTRLIPVAGGQLRSHRRGQAHRARHLRRQRRLIHTW